MTKYSVQWTKNAFYDYKQIVINKIQLCDNKSTVRKKYHSLIHSIDVDINMFPRMYDSVQTRFNISLNTDYRIALIHHLVVIYYIDDSNHMIYIDMIKNSQQDIESLLRYWIINNK